MENAILHIEIGVCGDDWTVTHVGESGLDAGVLARWLDANDAPGGGEEPQLTQLKGGTQNTLYLIERGPSEAPARMVLRMPGARADAARIDGLLREIRLVRALSGTDVPHAALIAADDTGAVLGMPFYVMQAIDGWSPMDAGWQPPFDTDFQHFITRTAWGSVWTRPGLDRRTRSLLTLAILATLGQYQDFRLHLHAIRKTGATIDEVAEALLQVAVYAGVPAANAAVRIAKEVLTEMASDLDPDEQA